MDNKFIPPNEEPKEQQLSFTLPAGVVTDLDQGCPDYFPAWCAPFSPQVGKLYDPFVAAWLINATLYAYQQYCNAKMINTYPPDVCNENGRLGCPPEKEFKEKRKDWPLCISCDPENVSTCPKDVINAEHLYWHEEFSLFKRYRCGFIGKINPLPGDSTNRILIAFRGTEKMSEWLENFDYAQKEVTFQPIDVKAKVHAGFWNMLNKSSGLDKPSLQDQLNDLIPKFLENDVPNEIYITGHSLGAAVDTLVVLDTILRYPNVKIISYIIGSPRVGDSDLSDIFRDLAKDKKYDFVFFRLVNTEDIVPTLPLPVAKNIVYSHIFPSQAGTPNTIGSISFTENVGQLGRNHNPMVYFFADKELMPKPPKPIPAEYDPHDLRPPNAADYY